MEQKNTKKKTVKTDNTAHKKTPTTKVNDLKVVVTNANGEIINESGNTIVTMVMKEDGKIMTSFMGDYNKQILYNLQKVNAKYFKGLSKKLLSKQKPENAKDDKAKTLKDNKTK